MYKSILFLLTSIILLTACGGTPAATENVPSGTDASPYVWVLVPSIDPEVVKTGAEAIAEYLKKETGLVIQPLVAKNFSEAVEAMCSGKAHIGALNTFNYLLAHEQNCADVALVATRFGSTFYSGQVVAGVDTGIATVSDLAGKSFCRPDPTSTSGWIIPSIAIRAEGLDPEKDLGEIIDVDGHQNVIKAVYEGKCEAGASFVDARSQVDFPDVNEKVIVITESAPIPNDTVSYVQSLTKEQRDGLTNAFLKLTTTEEGLKLLNGPQNWEGLEKVDDSFYEGFRQQLKAANVDIQTLVE